MIAHSLADFTFELPRESIALRPADPRESAQLLHVQANGALDDLHVRDLPGLLRAGDCLVVNDSWVAPAALMGARAARGEAAQAVRVQINLLERRSPGRWSAFAKPGKRLRAGDVLSFSAELRAEVLEKDGAEVLLAFSQLGAALEAALEEVGQAPLPPYILAQRPADARDRRDYQTAYADRAAPFQSVAAPTAGLHLTARLLAQLEQQGVQLARITLGVGAGTFLPVQEEDVTRHVLHAERFSVGEEACRRINAARAGGGRLIAAGTTSLRALEACAWGAEGIAPTQGETRLFIRPGHRFQSADGLLTNFHLPRSTLFMLVCAFSGTARMRTAYAHAVAAGYRFYSYGDASLLWRSAGAANG